MSHPLVVVNDQHFSYFYFNLDVYFFLTSELYVIGPFRRNSSMIKSALDLLLPFTVHNLPLLS